MGFQSLPGNQINFNAGDLTPGMASSSLLGRSQYTPYGASFSSAAQCKQVIVRVKGLLGRLIRGQAALEAAEPAVAPSVG